MEKGTVSVMSLRFFSGVRNMHVRRPLQIQASPIPNRHMMAAA